MKEVSFSFDTLSECISSVVGDTTAARFCMFSDKASDTLIELYHHFDTIRDYSMEAMDYQQNFWTFHNYRGNLVTPYMSNNQFSVVFIYNCTDISGDDLLYAASRVLRPRLPNDMKVVTLRKGLEGKYFATYISTGCCYSLGGVE